MRGVVKDVQRCLFTRWTPLEPFSRRHWQGPHSRSIRVAWHTTHRAPWRSNWSSTISGGNQKRNGCCVASLCTGAPSLAMLLHFPRLPHSVAKVWDCGSPDPAVVSWCFLIGSFSHLWGPYGRLPDL